MKPFVFVVGLIITILLDLLCYSKLGLNGMVCYTLGFITVPVFDFMFWLVDKYKKT